MKQISGYSRIYDCTKDRIEGITEEINQITLFESLLYSRGNRIIVICFSYHGRGWALCERLSKAYSFSFRMW